MSEDGADYDVAVPSDCNVSAKEIEKIEKYKDLSIELTSLWNIYEM